MVGCWFSGWWFASDSGFGGLRALDVLDCDVLVWWASCFPLVVVYLFCWAVVCCL